MVETIVDGAARARLLRTFSHVEDKPLFVGLSGGIGAGKTSVAQTWAQRGANVHSADQIAREVVEPGTVGFSQVINRFGKGLLLRDGTLDRRSLGRVVFSDPKKRVALERIIHPLIERRIFALVRETPAGQIAVYDVPLLVEKKMAPIFDVVVMVHAPLEERLVRLEERGLSEEEALERMAAQADEPKRRMVSDIWIDNNGTLSEVESVSADVLTRWLQPAASA